MVNLSHIQTFALLLHCSYKCNDKKKPPLLESEGVNRRDLGSARFGPA